MRAPLFCLSVRFLLVICLVTSCGSGQIGETVGVDGRAGDAPDGHRRGPADTSPEVTDSKPGQDTDVPEPDPCAPPNAEAWCPCEGNGDCASGKCLFHMGDLTCTVPCETECPVAWICKSDGGVDPMSFCFSLYPSLCLPCDGTHDCQGTDKCFEHGAEAGAFCSPICDASHPCPEGYSCEEMPTREGTILSGCRPEGGECVCSDYATSSCLGTSCQKLNEWGICTGWRECGEEGLSACDALVPAEEICGDEVDNDCDGEIDPLYLCPICHCGDGDCQWECGEGSPGEDFCPADCCVCGDGNCQTTLCNEGWVEGLKTCALDCAICSDGVCDPGEGPQACPEDCCGTCGDGVCKCQETAIEGEDGYCPDDCGQYSCGNDLCEPGENPVDCLEDCEPYACGNGLCEPGENPVSCPDDCGAACGDCVCDATESYSTCAKDCGFCGDGYCMQDCAYNAETADTCAADCGCGCDDEDPCTHNLCLADGGCLFLPKDDGAACDAPDICVGSCLTGVCVDVAVEHCNGFDDDCDGEKDEGGVCDVGKSDGEFCLNDYECASKHCDADQLGVLRCHATETACVYDEGGVHSEYAIDTGPAVCADTGEISEYASRWVCQADQTWFNATCGDGEYCAAGVCTECQASDCVIYLSCFDDSGVCCDPACDPSLEECVAVTTGGFACAAKSVAVAAGNFWMGCNNCSGSEVNDTSCYPNEHPYHEVYLDAYEIDKTEVTADQYEACVSAGGCTAAGTGDYATYQVAGKENHPINWVTWDQISAYCCWAGKELCTEAQWEKGARGGCENNGGLSNCKAHSRKFPWGGQAPTCDLAVMDGCEGETQDVCSLSPAGDSPYGLCDMSGNVLEWVADLIKGDYYCNGDAASGDEDCTECGLWPGFPVAWSNPIGPGNGSYRGVRGGSFNVGGVYGYLRVSLRGATSFWQSDDVFGGRCCRSYCGDGLCDEASGESCSTCIQDCSCAEGFVCTEGVCGFCTPDCVDKICGDDGCGGSCGECGEGDYCDAGSCQPLCGNGLCFDAGEDCITCPSDCGCDLSLEECIAVTTGGFACVTKMVSIPSGNFWMGCNNCAGSEVNDTSCDSDEDPYHEVYLDAYEIDKTKVTAHQYEACVSAGGCTAAELGCCATYQVPGKENHPINYVTWFQAESYCLWVGKELCTEAQWEKGARGGCEHNGGTSNCKAQSRKYPWGNAAPTCDLAVMWGCDGDTQAVCSKSPAGDSPYGLCDMAGNVWEWVSDWYQKDYYCDGDGATGDGYCTECGSWPDSPNPWNNPHCSAGGSVRGVRGGSFDYAYDYLRVSSRGYDDPSEIDGYSGSRCCRSDCGDGFCDEAGGESCSNCIQDCGCSEGDVCIDGLCIPGLLAGEECGGDDECLGGHCDPDLAEVFRCHDTETSCVIDETGLEVLTGESICADALTTRLCEDSIWAAGVPCPGPQDVCIDGECICQPACDDKDCGDDGCGGSCGECSPDLEECTEVATGGFKCTAKMVEVPAGNFWMGCNNCAGSTVNDTDCYDWEHPYHEVYLDTYEIDLTEVTAAQYAACVTAEGCEAPAGTGSYATYQVSGKENHPINLVTWYQVESYCLWAGKELCTEAQWEKGARGGCEDNGGTSNCKAQSRKYPWWGNAAPTCDLAVKGGCPGDTQAVCSLSPAGDSPYGLCDMAGNVWEWVADWYQSDYYCDGDGATGDGYCTECGLWPDSPNAWNNPYCNISGSGRVLRGGSFDDPVYFLRVSGRGGGGPSYGYFDFGGRCCRSECGDGFCDEAGGESCSNCIQDCGCSEGDVCIDGLCIPGLLAGEECGGADECLGGHCDPDLAEVFRCHDTETSCVIDETGLEVLTGESICADALTTRLCEDSTWAVGVPCPGPQDACIEGACVCQPACDGKDCDDNDGCGGVCGCESDLEECTEVTTGGWACTAKMVEVPAGNFWMGCNNCAGSTVNDTDCDDQEDPYHEVYLDGYEMDRTEVTAGQYLACVTAEGCTAAGTGSYATYQVSGKESHPINYMTWFQVDSYCLWAGKELCTEAQWEKGARGGCEDNGGTSNCKADSRKYPWGNAASTCDLAVMGGCDGDTQPVCSKSPAGDSPYGLCDMAGNVWEWVADWFGSDYYCAGSGADTSYPWTYCPECGTWPGSPNAWNNPYCNVSGSGRVLRGGSFAYDGDYARRVSHRNYFDPSGSDDALGGRCCRSE